MFRNIINQINLICCIIILSSCGKSNQEAYNNTPSLTKDELTKSKDEGLPSDYLGNYHGIQTSYFMRNQFGYEMVINGNKISVPSIDYKFILKENNFVSLQQINIEDHTRVYYEGKYKIISKDSKTTKIECLLSDGNTSNPNYILIINKSNKKGICRNSNEPQFKLEKNI